MKSEKQTLTYHLLHLCSLVANHIVNEVVHCWLPPIRYATMKSGSSPLSRLSKATELWCPISMFPSILFSPYGMNRDLKKKHIWEGTCMCYSFHYQSRCPKCSSSSLCSWFQKRFFVKLFQICWEYEQLKKRWSRVSNGPNTRHCEHSCMDSIFECVHL